MVIDYSQTVIRFTQLDAYPLPKIEEVVNNVAQDKFYSSVDLHSAYYQVPLTDDERPCTAFEAMGKLYQYKRLPFVVTNGVSAFQRVIECFIRRNKLKKVYAYLDDLTVTGSTMEEHDQNLQALLEAAKRDNFTLNEEKSKIRMKSVNLLGYQTPHGQIRPDCQRLQPLLNLPPPESLRVCQHCRTCAEIKPRFCKPAPESLVKATRPWERLSMDFKGPLRGLKPYLLIIIYEYSRYSTLCSSFYTVFPC